MKIALGQINTTVGDITGNEHRIVAALERAEAAGAHLLIVPELALTGYPPRDLLLRSKFVEESQAAMERLALRTRSTALLVGYVSRHSIRPGRGLHNSAALLHQGAVIARRHKTLLPTYDVFDEDRYFDPSESNEPVEFMGRKLGITICEDIWNDEDFWAERRYTRNPAVELKAAGVEIILNLSASPWHLGKDAVRLDMVKSLAAKLDIPVVYCNLVGGNDELIFDGRSLVVNGQADLVAVLDDFKEDFQVVDPWQTKPVAITASVDEEKLYKALVLGLRDYLHKCGFKSAVLGLSGGIDSAITAVLAADALGRENLRGISLPSEFSSQGSLDDARVLAANLGIQYDVIPIQPPFQAVKGQLSGIFAGRTEDTTEENIQARLRGVILMAMSNKFGSLLLTTGNKSELAVGYCTLYGDMCGGLAVISDVPKTMIYRLSRWINREREIIPASSIEKPPSAELRPNQTDQDSLPEYEVLDAILEEYVVKGSSYAEIVAKGFSSAVVHRVLKLIDGSEYKRRQAAPGLKVTTKAFGVGRRIPIAQRFRSIPS